MSGIDEMGWKPNADPSFDFSDIIREFYRPYALKVIPVFSRKTLRLGHSFQSSECWARPKSGSSEIRINHDPLDRLTALKPHFTFWSINIEGWPFYGQNRDNFPRGRYNIIPDCARS